MTSRHRSGLPGRGFADRLKQRAERQKAQLTAWASQRAEAKAPEPEQPRIARDCVAILKAIDALRLFYVAEPEIPRSLSTQSRDLIEAAIEAMNSGEKSVLLVWPPHPVCLPALVDLIALGDMASTPQRQVKRGPGWVDTVADAPVGLRAVLFPYGRARHGPAREIQIDRNELAALQLQHVLRGVHGYDDPALKDYHTVLKRVGAMTGTGKDGRSYAEYEHPVLDEIVPHGSAIDGCHGKGELLWRTKSKTDLGRFTRTGFADQPDKARFYLFEFASDRVAQELSRLHAAPDIFLLDLSKSGQGRLGRDWIERARKAVDTLRDAHPTTGVLAITDDPWSCDAARFEVLGTRIPQSKKLRPAASRTIYAPTGAILGDVGSTPIAFAGCGRIIVDGFSGEAESCLAKLKIIAAKLQDRGNSNAADAVRVITAKVRRCVSLAGSLRQLSEFLERETVDAIAADAMSAYRVDVDIAALTDPRNGATQVASEELTSVCAEATRLVSGSEAMTPMSSLLDDHLARVMRSSSRTIFVLRNEMIADFTRDRLSRAFERFDGKLESDVIRLTTRQGLADLADFTPSFRNQFKRAIIVAPTRQSALEVLSQPWLPEEITILADSETLRFAARDATRLASQLNLPELRDRLNRFADTANAGVAQLGSHVVSLDVAVEPAPEVDFPDGAVIDLAGPQRGDRRLIELRLQSGQMILARPRTSLVQQDESQSVRRFIEVAASDISVGDEICVIGPRFIEKARTLLNITAAAAEEIRDYHQMVQKRFAELEGDTRSARLKLLCERMGQPIVHTATAAYWVTLEEEVEKPLHDVIAHAPRDREVFMRFTGALGIGAQLAARFWAWAVIAQRSSRQRAGAAFHEAYTGILTDQHAALAANRARAAEIRALRAAADDYVSRVTAVKTMGRS